MSDTDARAYCHIGSGHYKEIRNSSQTLEMCDRPTDWSGIFILVTCYSYVSEIENEALLIWWGGAKKNSLPEPPHPPMQKFGVPPSVQLSCTSETLMIFVLA